MRPYLGEGRRDDLPLVSVIGEGGERRRGGGGEGDSRITTTMKKNKTEIAEKGIATNWNDNMVIFYWNVDGTVLCESVLHEGTQIQKNKSMLGKLNPNTRDCVYPIFMKKIQELISNPLYDRTVPRTQKRSQPNVIIFITNSEPHKGSKFHDALLPKIFSEKLGANKYKRLGDVIHHQVADVNVPPLQKPKGTEELLASYVQKVPRVLGREFEERERVTSDLKISVYALDRAGYILARGPSRGNKYYVSEHLKIYRGKKEKGGKISGELQFDVPIIAKTIPSVPSTRGKKKGQHDLDDLVRSMVLSNFLLELEKNGYGLGFTTKPSSSPDSSGKLLYTPKDYILSMNKILVLGGCVEEWKIIRDKFLPPSSSEDTRFSFLDLSLETPMEWGLRKVPRDAACFASPFVEDGLKKPREDPDRCGASQTSYTDGFAFSSLFNVVGDSREPSTIVSTVVDLKGMHTSTHSGILAWISRTTMGNIRLSSPPSPSSSYSFRRAEI